MTTSVPVQAEPTPPPAAAPPPSAPPRPHAAARRLHLGVLPWILGVLIVLVLASSIAGALFRDMVYVWSLSFPLASLAVGGAQIALLLAAVGAAIGTLIGVRGLQRGVPGEVRVVVMAWGIIIHAIAVGLTIAVLIGAFGGEVDISSFSWINDAFDLDAGWALALIATVFVTGASLLTALIAFIACWGLIPLPVRQVIWAVVDSILLIAFVLVTLLLPITVPDENPELKLLAAVRLAVTFLFGIRVFARLLPPMLDVIETMGVRQFVAARHLRARKSGFLTAISFLAVLAVTVSSCALTTTLSVMGGFRYDLKRKILGSNAHVVIDRAHGEFDGWGPVLERTRRVEGVEGVSPYVSGEVMVSSSSNLGGAVLRGIDTAAIGRVTELPRQMRHGRLEYLDHPERLLDLPDEELHGQLLPLEPGSWRRRRRHRPAEDDTPNTSPAAHDSLVRDLDEELGPAPPDEDGPTKVASPDADQIRDSIDHILGPGQGPHRDVLPGVIIGQELARTLRVYVGDEVNVVAPLGDLGPAGPMPKSRPFRVAGIFYSGMYEYDMKYCYVTLPTAQRFLGTGDAISGIEIKVDDIEHAPAVAHAIKRAIGRRELRVRDWQELNRQLFGALALEKLAMFIALGIAIMVAGFCVFGTLQLMVQEKSREVAILKAMGASDGTVVSLFMIEGLLLGLFGALLGTGLGYVACFAAENFGVQMNPEVYYIDKLPVHVDPVEFGLVAVAAAVACLLATAYPAISASRLRPSEQLRNQ